MVLSEKPRIELLNMDCMTLMAKTPDKFYDLCICDPPYGINIGKVKFYNNTTKNKLTLYKSSKWDNAIPSKEYFKELFRISQKQIIWGGNFFTEFLKPSKDWIIWDKCQSPEMHFSMAELAWCSFGKGIRIFKRSWAKDANRVSSNPSKAKKYLRIHPCQKSISLYEWLLMNYAKPGDKIFDSHAGSFSSGIAAYKLGFDITATELDKDYYEASITRFRQFSSQQTLTF